VGVITVRMLGKAIPWMKVVVHVLCALPFLVLVWAYRDGSLGAQADPVNYITHFTGDWCGFGGWWGCGLSFMLRCIC